MLLQHCYSFILVLFCLLHLTAADYYYYNGVELSYGYNTGRGLVELYAEKDKPNTIFHNDYNDHSFIETDLSATASHFPTSFELVIAQVIDGSSIGYAASGSDKIELCCTLALQNQGLCSNLGRVILNQQNATAARVFYYPFINSTELTQLRAHYSIQQTGEHLVMLVNCNQLATVTVSGSVAYVNPYGHLPGRVFGYLTFYLVLALFYTAVGCVWLLLSLIYRKELTSIQYCISVVLLICTIEAALSEVDYLVWNSSGVHRRSLFALSASVAVIKQTLSRMLLICVCLGWGTVTPTLSTSSKWKLIVLGVLYFASSGALEIVSRSAVHSDDAERIRLMLSLPVAFLNSLFYWWLFISLSRLLNYLSVKKQSDKLKIYQRFTAVIIISLIAVLCYAVYQVYFTSSRQQLLHWSNVYLLDNGIPELIYSFVLVSIACLWRPSTESRKLAYQQLVSGTDDFESFAKQHNNRNSQQHDVNGVISDLHHHSDVDTIELGNLSSDDDDVQHEAVQAHFTIADDDDDDEKTPHHSYSEAGHIEKGSL